MHNFGRRTLKVLLSAAILFGIAWKFDFRAVLDILPSLSPYWVFCAFLLIALQLIVGAGRLSSVVGLFNRKLNFRDSFFVTIESQFFAQTFVSFLGGDALRIWKIRQCGASLGESVQVVTLDRLMGIFVNHLLLLSALPWLLSIIGPGHIRTGLLVLAVAGFASICVVLLLGWQSALVSKVIGRFGQNRLIVAFLKLSTLGRFFLSPTWGLGKAAVFSLAIALMNCFAFFAILRGWQVDPVTAIGCALLVPGILEIAMLPVSIAGWGVREGAAIAAFGSLGVPVAIAFGTSLIFALMALAIGLIGGLVWLVDAHKLTGAGRPAESLKGY